MIKFIMALVPFALTVYILWTIHNGIKANKRKSKQINKDVK